MIKNLLIGSGEEVTLAVGQTYTVKDDEVFINNSLYKKCDIEISLQNASASNNQNYIKVGVSKRDGVFNLPADHCHFNEWLINNATPNNLSECVTLITGLIQCVNNNSSGNIDLSNVILKIENMAVNKRDNTNTSAIQVGDEIDGEYPTGSGRFIKALVNNLPWNLDNLDGNLTLIQEDYAN